MKMTAIFNRENPSHFVRKVVHPHSKKMKEKCFKTVMNYTANSIFHC